MSRPRENPPIPFRRPELPHPPRAASPDGVPPYTEFACVTNFSFLRGASHPAELVIQAKALGHTAIGIADRNSLAGMVRAHAAAKKEGLRLVVGTRLDTVEGHSILCYPEDRAAYGRLCRLLTRGKCAAPKGECHVDLDDVCAAADGQVLIAVPPERLDGEAGVLFDGLVARLGQALPGQVWIAAHHLYRGDDRRRLLALATLSQTHGVPLVATNDVHYHDPARRPLQDVITCIREKCTLAEAGFRLFANAERHLKPPEEMARLFRHHPDAVAAGRDILARCTFSLDELAYNYPDEPVPPGQTPQRHLEALTWNGAAVHYPDGIPDSVCQTLKKELALIEELDYAHYFLTVHDIVAFARGQGILCQGRGSAANSAVCYCLGVTAVDPARINLLFERFISGARKEPPDIDVDFEHERREEVIQYIYERYGRHRASLTATVITYRPRSAVREVGKVMGLTEDVTSALASTVWGSWGSEIPETQIREAGLDLADPHLKRTIALTQELLGFPRHLSQHVGGFVLTQDPLEEMIPIGNAAMEDRTFIEWDKDDIDELKILKVDVLGLGMLTCIAKCFAFIARHYHLDLSLESMPKEDPVVYEMLQRADAIGVFQVESRAQLNMLPRLRPQCFYDLVIEVAIVRPGPIQGDMVHPYLRRRDGLETIAYPSPAPGYGPADELERVLSRTLGVPLFQEQAMQIAIDAAKFTPDEANQLRRAMATFRRMGTIHTLEQKLVGRMIERGYDPDFAARCFDQIKGFGEYGFPESHAASFALLVYASSWLKCHFPDVFCAGLLNAQPMGFYAPAQIVRDAREHDIEVRPVDVNHSFWDNTLEETYDGAHAVRLGFRQVDGLGREIMEEFTDRRAAMPDGIFAGMEEARARGGLGLAVLERLAAADALRSLGLDRRQGLWAVRGLVSDTALPLFEAADADATGHDISVALPEMRLSEHVVADYQTQRLSLKAHPLSFLRERYRARRFMAARDLFTTRQNQSVAITGVVLVRQKPGTAKGVVFMTIEDETGIANIVVWNKVLQRFRKVVMGARLVLIRGTVQRSGDIIHVIARRLEDLTGDLDLLSDDPLPEVVAHADHVRAPLHERALPARLGRDAERSPSRRAEHDLPIPLSRADEVVRPQPDNAYLRVRRSHERTGRPAVAQALKPKRKRVPATPARGSHPRNVRIIPKSRDFH